MQPDKNQNETSGKKASRLVWGICIALDAVLLCFFTFLLYSAAQARMKTTPALLEKPATTAGLPPAQLQQPEQEAVQQSTETAQQPQVQQSTFSAIPEVSAEPQLPTSTETVTTAAPGQTVAQAVLPKPAKEITPAQQQQKAVKVLLYYRDAKAKTVTVSGSFATKPIKLAKKGARWETGIFLQAGTYQYEFLVDAKTVQDPLQPLRQNGKALLIVRK